MKDHLVWHYLTIRSDDIQVGDYYCFCKTGINDPPINGRKYAYLIKLSITEITVMRLKQKRKDCVWQAVQRSKRKKNKHYRVQGKLIHSLSHLWYKED